jgi:hypothetical protein
MTAESHALREVFLGRTGAYHDRRPVQTVFDTGLEVEKSSQVKRLRASIQIFSQRERDDTSLGPCKVLRQEGPVGSRKVNRC